MHHNSPPKKKLMRFSEIPRYTVEGYLGEIKGGVTYINTVKNMLEEAENDWPKMLARLQRVRATLLSKKQFLVNLTGDKVGRPSCDKRHSLGLLSNVCVL